MRPSISLVAGRVGSGTNCERGCNELIMSPYCPTHGHEITVVRLGLRAERRFITGEISLLEGLRFMQWVREGCPVPTIQGPTCKKCAHKSCADIRASRKSAPPHLSVESVELVYVETGVPIPA